MKKRKLISMWREKVQEYETQMIEDLKGLLAIKSVRNDTEATEDAPVGPGPKAALEYMYQLAERDGFNTFDTDHLAGRIEIGKGEELFGILGHVDVVPAGDGWDSDPFDPVETDDRIIARGTLDDKGPTIAAYYAVKILNDMNVDWKREYILLSEQTKSLNGNVQNVISKLKKCRRLVLHLMQNSHSFTVKKGLRHLRLNSKL